VTCPIPQAERLSWNQQLHSLRQQQADIEQQQCEKTERIEWQHRRINDLEKQVPTRSAIRSSLIPAV
jgi:chromosome segregation ATPase